MFLLSGEQTDKWSTTINTYFDYPVSRLLLQFIATKISTFLHLDVLCG